jgi:hypothetical protein
MKVEAACPSVAANNTAVFHMVQTSNATSINTKLHAQPKEKNNGQYLVQFFQFVTQEYED